VTTDRDALLQNKYELSLFLQSNLFLADIAWDLQRTSDAIYHFQKAFKFIDRTSNPLFSAVTQSLLLSLDGHHEEALMTLRGLRGSKGEKEKSGESKGVCAFLYGCMGMTLFRLENYEKAAKKLFKAIQKMINGCGIFENEIGDPNSIFGLFDPSETITDEHYYSTLCYIWSFVDIFDEIAVEKCLISVLWRCGTVSEQHRDVMESVRKVVNICVFYVIMYGF
jgi:hypothetical protein